MAGGDINLVDYNTTTAFWSFLIYCLVVIFVAVFFLFYVSRVLAQLLSKLIRWFTWRHHKAYIEFESLQIAPLGGRILFRNLRYHSRNQSITVLHGFVSFRYWLWNVRTENDPIPEDSTGSKDTGADTHGKDNCRITCHLVGLEWFMYNRTPAYDVLATTLGLNPDATPFYNSSEGENPSVSVNMENEKQEDTSADSWFRRCLPVKIACETGAIIMGNAHLPSLLVASFPSAHGMYSATKARSSLDPYRTVLLTTFETPSIDLRPNADYNTTIAGRNMGNDVPDISRLPPRKPSRFQQIIRPIKAEWNLYFGVSRKVAEEWHGLPRYNQNISQDNLKESKFTEYAMVRNVLQCNELGLRYYTDVAGKVPEPSQDGSDVDYDLPPEWGIELIIDEAVISYGPWADRQRSEIQNFYFPNTYRTMDPTPEVLPGQDRVHAALQIMITFSSSVTIKIPTQEKSKDWKYCDPEFQAVQGGKSMRPFGWLELKAAHGSMVSVDIPMVYDTEGYKNVVLVDLQNLVVTSSVNYAPVINLKELKMVCQLQNPLVWNAQRDWDFEITLDTAKIFLLRDHLTLIQDLSKDWTSGPSVDMAHFVPFKYDFDIKLPNFQLYTYVNEHNIINEPTEIDENAFIIAAGQTLDCKVVLPFVQFNPEITAITFDVEIRNGGLELQLPLAHTLGEFSTPDSKKFAIIPSLVIKGTYEYYDFVDAAHIESLNLDVKGHGVTVKLFGNVIRYVLILMDNYAGLYINFVTMEEYRKKRSDDEATERVERIQANAKPPSDPFEVYVHFLTTDTTLVLPENLYSSDNYSEITCAEIQVDLRNLDVYMDMQVNISPMTWSRKVKELESAGSKPSRGDQNYLFIDGISVYAHRLFGPLPKTTTYVANWKMDIGSIYGQIKPSFLLGATSFAKAFVYNLKDGDNAFPPEYATITPPDITFVDLSVKEVDVSIWGEDVVSQILLKDGVIVHFDDIINERYIGRVVLKLQSLIVRSMALTEAASDEHAGEAEQSHHEFAPWVEIANLNCAFDVTVYVGAGDWRERREKQQAFVQEQDRETLRCPYIYKRKGHVHEVVAPPNLKGNHFGTLYVPPLTSDPAAMKEDYIGSSGSIVEFSSENGSIIEYASSASSSLGNRRKILRRASSSFSIGMSVDSDGSSDTDSNDSNIDRWPDMESDDLEMRYSSSDDEESVDDYEYPGVAQDHDDDEITNMPSVPARSIPYSTYLKRFTVSSNRSTNQRHQFLPPPRVIFTQLQTGEILEDVPRHHPCANFDESFGIKGKSDGMFSSAQPKGNETTGEKRTTIIVEATQDVKILLTPILLKIIQEFLEAINAEEWDLETMLDVTQMDYVELLTRMMPSKLHSQQFLVNIPRIHLRFIQDVMMPDALNGGDDINMIKTRYELSGANLCAIDIILDDAAIIAALKYEDQEFEKFEPKKIHIASFKVVESRANVDFSRFKLNARFVPSSMVRIFGIPDQRHQFSNLGINHLSYVEEPVIADISFEKFKLRLVHSHNPNYFSADLEKLQVLFINQSAEIVAGSICSWLTFVKDLKTILNRFQLRRSKQLQTLFSEIARFSAQKVINTDPVFLTRPSTTLRLGTMYNRGDSGWKLLAHIRHCMRLMPRALMDTLQESLKKPELESFSTETMYEIVISVFSNWRSWEMEDIRTCRLFSDVFERKPILGPESVTIPKETWMYNMLRYSANSIQLQLGEFEAAIYDEQMENKMRITNLEFIFESRYKADALAQTSLYSKASLANDTNRLSTGFLDVAVKTGFRSAEVDVNPVIIAFTRHILRIERIFTPQFNKVLESKAETRPTEGRRSMDNPSSPRPSLHIPRETAATATTTSSEPMIMDVIDCFDIVFNGMAVVETIRITMTAHNLSAQVIFSQIQVSALNFTKQRIFPSQDVEGISTAKSSGSNQDGVPATKSGLNKLIASLAINISSINSSLKERVYSKDSTASMPTKELLTFGIVGINSEVTLSQFTPVKRPKQTKASVPREVINVLVTFKQINVALPRSILKLYLFAKDWREENMQSFDFLFQGVMNEWEVDRKRQPKTVVPSTPRELKIQIVVKTFTLESHMLPSLLFQYEAGDLMIMLHDVPPGLPYSVPQLTYTAQLLRQSVDFIANRQKSKTGDKSRLLEDKHAASFSLPVIRASGSVMNVIDFAAPARTRRSSITALARGARQPKKLESSVSFDFVEMTLNVNMLDHILTAQSLLGAEVNELVDILSKGKESPPATTSPVVAPTPTESGLLYSVKVSLVGLSIAAVSPSAVLYFESDLLKGVITNNPNPVPVMPFSTEIVRSRLAWRLYAQSITLSLNHHAGNIRMGSRAEDIRARKLRLAYITINLNIQNFSPNVADKDRFAQTSVSTFYVSFLKIHALMQPQSVGRIIGLYSYYTHELERRKELKASDMTKLADNTKRIIKSLDVDVPAYKDNTRSMLESTEIFLNIDDVAVAIPLDRREDIMDSSERMVEAFLISATSISVLTKSGETSSGTLMHLCAQFVPRFDQSKDEHFRSRIHPKMNRLLFPNISCQVKASKDSPGHQKVSSNATVSGFELDIDPTIVRYINTLSDVYDNSKGLVTSLTGDQAPSTPARTDGSSSTTPAMSAAGTPKSEIPAPQASTNVIWKIENTFQCSKSICRFYPKSYVSKLPKTSKFMDSDSNFAQVGVEVSGVDRFIIPGLSLWTSLRIPLGDNIAELQAAGPPRIHAEVNVHSCENTFYPSLVPFFQEIVTGLKLRIRRQRMYTEPQSMVLVTAPAAASALGGSARGGVGLTASPNPALAHDGAIVQQVVPKRQELVITCYLSLERTKIEFNCQPMAKVMSVMTFEQGNILMSYNSDRHGNTSTTIAGTFEGASSDTHHIFSQDKGFRLVTKGMVFNAVAETKRQTAENKKTLSVTVDFRQIAMDFDMRQAEILVLMKMIWMDQANYLIRDGLTVSRSTSSSQGFETALFSQPSPTATSPGGALVSSGKRESSFLGYNIFVVARLQQMKITGDLGSQIGKMDFKLHEVRLRTKLRPFHPRMASISTGPLDLQFLPMERGWLEGYLIIEGFTLETLSKVHRHPTFPCSIVEVVLQTKRLTTMLSYDYKNFFVMALEPVQIVLLDDWKGPNLDRDVSMMLIAYLQGLRLLACAKTVSVFKTIMSRVSSMMDQKMTAAKEELKKPLLSASSLQPTSASDTQPLMSAVDSAIDTLKTQMQAGWNAIGLVQFTVGDVDASFFPYLLSDKECTHASIHGAKVKFNRDVIYPQLGGKPAVIHRVTTLNLALLSLQKYTLHVVDAKAVKSYTLEQWFDRIRNPSPMTIAKLPATSQIMESWQELGSNVIEHICRTQFAGLIDITTDYRLFRGVEKNFQRFLEELSVKNFKGAGDLPQETVTSGDAAATTSAALDIAIPGTATSEDSNSRAAQTTAARTAATSGSGGSGTQAEPFTTVSPSSPIPTVVSGAAVDIKSGNSPTTTAPSTMLPTAPRWGGDIHGPAAGDGGTAGRKETTTAASANLMGNTNVTKAGTSEANGASSGDNTSSASNATAAVGGDGSSGDDGAGRKRQLIFKAREQIVFKPALDVLPNTPLPLGHLGFKKEDIPPIVHGVTTALETGLVELSKIQAKKVELSGLLDLWGGKVMMDDDDHV